MKMIKELTMIAVSAFALTIQAYEDPWRAVIMNSMSGSGASYNHYDGMSDLMNARSSAKENGDWDEALSLMKRFIDKDYWIDCDVNKASDHVELSLLYWNTGDREEARDAMSAAINFMRYGHNLGNNCWQDASRLYNKMRNGGLPSKFSPKELECVLNYVMEVPRAQFNKTIDAQMARYDTMIRRMDSEIRTIEFQGRIMEHRAKFKARQDYHDATGRTFDPSNPPEYGSSAREDWNAAKRIYDIFGD